MIKNHVQFCGRTLIVVVALLCCMGLLMVFDTTAAEALDRVQPSAVYLAFFKQIFYLLLGIGAAVLVWKVGAEKILRYSGPLLLLGTLLLALTLVPGVGQKINGARRWLGTSFFSFQPSEMVKFLLPIYYIHAITSREKEIDLRSFLRILALLSVPLALILIEPDTGSVVLILAALITLFVLTRLRWTYWALPLLVVMVLGGAVASQKVHVQTRIQIYLHPDLDIKGKGHQPHQAKIAAGSGGFFGKGAGQSMQKQGYLPEARSDYIVAIFAEEFGFLGVMLLVFLYMIFAYLGFFLAAKSHDLRLFYLIALITFLITFQAFFNLGVVSGLLPSKGTNLPFFSQGGSSLIVNCMALALLLKASLEPVAKLASRPKFDDCKAGSISSQSDISE